MKISINVVIGILLVLVIIYILYNKKQEVFTGIYPNLTVELELELNNAVNLSLEPDQEPISIASVLTKDFLDDSTKKQEIYDKLKELILPNLYYISRAMRIYAIDYKCGNAENDQILMNQMVYLVKIITSLTSVYREIYSISIGNTSISPLNLDDTTFFNQIICIRKTYLPFDDPKILNEYDLNNYDMDITSASYTFSIKILEFIIALANEQPTDYCLNVDMTKESNVLQSYIYFDGSERKCNPATTPPTIAATLSSPTIAATLPPPTVAATLPPSGPATLSPTIVATLPPTVAATLPPTVAATLPPTRTSGTTVTGYDSSIFGSSYSNVTPAPNNLPRGINLINSQGPNNFFLPNIRIS